MIVDFSLSFFLQHPSLTPPPLSFLLTHLSHLAPFYLFAHRLILFVCRERHLSDLCHYFAQRALSPFCVALSAWLSLLSLSRPPSWSFAPSICVSRVPASLTQHMTPLEEVKVGPADPLRERKTDTERAALVAPTYDVTRCSWLCVKEEVK